MPLSDNLYNFAKLIVVSFCFFTFYSFVINILVLKYPDVMCQNEVQPFILEQGRLLCPSHFSVNQTAAAKPEFDSKNLIVILENESGYKFFSLKEEDGVEGIEIKN